MKRAFEFLFGVILALIVIGRYNGMPLLRYLGLNIWVELVLCISIILIASRLIAGPRKDYSGRVRRILEGMFGSRKNRNKTI